ncbi:LamG-like jellyroll fold domain-containing protein [Fluviicola chungangensis]|nr:LamG-like jellyroll fold domain-containing protein [Fluviicola chungangensis]
MKILLLLLTIHLSFCSYSQLAGNALRFDASNGYCTANLPTVFDNIPSNDFTIECWVKQESNTTSKRVFFAQKDVNNFCSILVNGVNVAYFFLCDNGTYYSVSTQVTLSPLQWTHLAFTWDASTNTITSYINGIQVNGINGGSSTFGNDGVMTIGARSDGQQIYKGSIDELRVWDDIRTPCEIFGSMNSEFTTAQPNLVASYSFNEGVANATNTGVTTLNDLTTTYDATLTGFLLSGTTSNWVTSQAGITQTNNNSETYLSNDIVTACGSYTWIDGNTYFADNNLATYTYTSVNGCDSTILLDLTVDLPVMADAPTNIIECAYFELPVLSSGSYFTATNGGGTPLNAGDSVSSSQTLYVYAENGTCSDENSFLITIDSVVTADSPGDVTACDSYELPALTFGNYFTESNGGGSSLLAGDLVSGSQTIFVYAENGTCSDENSFTISINESPLNTVSVAANLLTADQAGASYQWLDCNNGNTPISGATGQNYSPTMNGSYAVEIAENGCVDTSACVNIATIGIDEKTFTSNIILFPNPTSGMLTIVSDIEFANASLTARNVLGQEVYRKMYSSVKQIDLNLEGAVGVYFIEIVDGGKVSLLKVIKE